LNRFATVVPASDPVVASQGIGGRFAPGRKFYAISSAGGSIAVGHDPIWFVVAPNVGIETAPEASELALVAALSGPLHARSVVVGHGVWGFEYIPKAGQHALALPGIPTDLPAWEFQSASGAVLTTGNTAGWRVVGNGRPGYLLYGDYWNETQGPAVASATLAGHGAVSIGVWDDTTGILLAQRRIQLTGGSVQARIPFAVPTPHPQSATFHGYGPFTIDPLPPPPGDTLEVRIFDYGHGSKPVALSVGIAPGS
jgi:hypothetical protein